nr:hypothetical protein [Tanacetum cinerariifolium]
RAHCDVLLNNMCEVFNRQLVDGRDKPIITCLEFIKEYLMKRIVNVQNVISKSDGPLTPNATKGFNIIMKEGDQCVVNMRTRECSCRKWELTGIPCKHALAAIWDMAGNREETAIPKSYCHQVHWLSTWKDMYRPPKKRKKSAAELAEGMVKGNKLSKADSSRNERKSQGYEDTKYLMKRQKQKINGLIEEALLESEAKGVKVFRLGLLKQGEELNKSSELAGRYFDFGASFIPASIEYSKEVSPLCTMLSRDEWSVRIVEHLLSALAGTGVDNCCIEIVSSHHNDTSAEV